MRVHESERNVSSVKLVVLIHPPEVLSACIFATDIDLETFNGVNLTGLGGPVKVMGVVFTC